MGEMGEMGRWGGWGRIQHLAISPVLLETIEREHLTDLNQVQCQELGVGVGALREWGLRVGPHWINRDKILWVDCELQYNHRSPLGGLSPYLG
jgi:hypothetical protein